MMLTLLARTVASGVGIGTHTPQDAVGLGRRETVTTDHADRSIPPTTTKIAGESTV
jgi:hypothetical protein